MCQCPLGLVTHFYSDKIKDLRSKGYSCQCPLGLVTHFYITQKGEFSYGKHVSMPSRACNSFLRYLFKNLGFMRFPEPVFSDICQNILATTVFCAC